MKAVLDHVGIAVRDLDAALAFYRDGLGLEIEASEVVASQRVTAHFLDTGASRLELLEPTSPESAIARSLDKRGPGLHHITLRVEDLDAVLAHLKARGVRLVDETARPGAESARIAFIHPSSAHGVLVELKEAPPDLRLEVVRFAVGRLQVAVLHDGPFRLDGGAMFGVVPRALWERKARPDERHRIQLAMRPALVEGEWGRLLIDCGAGDKWAPKDLDIFAFDRSRTLDHALTSIGLSTADVPAVLASHLHFDHFGGATVKDADGSLRPRFDRARHLIRAAEWHDATHPHERNRASYLQDDFVPLASHGVVDFYDADHEVRPGVRVERTGGHTGQHQIVFIESDGQTAVFAADVIPTTAHIQDPWIMGYDLYPMDTLAVKRRLIRTAIDREFIIIFEHDPLVAAGYIRERDGRRFVEPVG